MKVWVETGVKVCIWSGEFGIWLSGGMKMWFFSDYLLLLEAVSNNAVARRVGVGMDESGFRRYGQGEFGIWWKGG